MPVTIDKEADMNNQACDGITDAGKDLVLSCIKSQELRDHMRKYLYFFALDNRLQQAVR